MHNRPRLYSQHPAELGVTLSTVTCGQKKKREKESDLNWSRVDWEFNTHLTHLPPSLRLQLRANKKQHLLELKAPHNPKIITMLSRVLTTTEKHWGADRFMYCPWRITYLGSASPLTAWTGKVATHRDHRGPSTSVYGLFNPWHGLVPQAQSKEQTLKQSWEDPQCTTGYRHKYRKEPLYIYNKARKALLTHDSKISKGISKGERVLCKQQAQVQFPSIKLILLLSLNPFWPPKPPKLYFLKQKQLLNLA